LNPQLDDLPGLIDLIRKKGGSRAGLAEAIFEKWTNDNVRHGFTLHSIEANTISSLSDENLGIIDEQARLSAFGRQLYSARKDDRRLKDLLAAHLLQSRGGWQFARALEVLWRRGRRPTRALIATYLRAKYGIGEWADSNNISSLHTFLEWCGIVVNYRVDESEVERVLGVVPAELEVVEGFTLETRACLDALVRLGGRAAPGAIRQAAEGYLHTPLDANQFTARMTPLVEAKLIDFEGRRGSRTSLYVIRDAKKAELLAAIARDLAIVGVVPDEVFEHDFGWVVDRLWDMKLNKNERGKSLEVLAGMICSRLGLRHIQLRNRTEFEVDVTADYVGAGYQTWSAQCKAYRNARFRSNQVLREFGIAVLNRYSVLLFVTTSDFTEDAVLTINRIVRQTNIQVVMVSGQDLQALARDEGHLFDLVRQRSEAARRSRLGARPVEVFQEFDNARDWLLTQKPESTDVWVHLQRRDLLLERPLVATLLAAWLETQRASAEFDESYLEKIRLQQ
jgi:hypothetical protein